MTEPVADPKLAPEIPVQQTKRRSRPSRTAEVKVETKKENITVNQLTGMIYLGSSGAASVTGVTALATTEDEATQIATAIVGVMAQYDFKASAKSLAWANLVGVLATVYGIKLLPMILNKQAVNSDSEEHF